MYDPFTEFESVQLDNGLKIYSRHIPDCPWEKVTYLIHSGSKDDPENYYGVAHFLEHVVSDNTKLKGKGLENFASKCGGAVNLGKTGYFSTTYEMFLPLNKTRLGLKLFGQMLVENKIINSIEKERSVILNEFRRKFDLDFHFQNTKHMFEALYPKHWLSTRFANLGSPESINLITHSELQSFYNRHYVPANISIVASGGFTTKQLTQLINTSPFGQNKPGVRNPSPPLLTVCPVPLENYYELKKSDHISLNDILNSGCCKTVITFPATINIKLITILSRMIKRDLMHELREKRAWSYTINVNNSDYKEFFSIQIKCDHLPPEIINDVKKIINTCLNKILTKQKLFEKIKHQEIVHFEMIDLSITHVVNIAVDDVVYHDRIIPFSEEIKAFKNIDLQDLQSLSSYLSPELRWTMLTLP